MDILLLDKQYIAIGLIDDYESMIWTDRYNQCGDFELVMPADLEVVKLFEPGLYLYNRDSKHYMIVEEITIVTDAESGNRASIVGRSLESILDRRVIWDYTKLSGSLQLAIRKLLREAIMGPSNPERRIDNFIFKESTDEKITKKEMTVEAEYHGENLYDVICDLCNLNDIGFQILPFELEYQAPNLVINSDLRDYKGKINNTYVLNEWGFFNTDSAVGTNKITADGVEIENPKNSPKSSLSYLIYVYPVNDSWSNDTYTLTFRTKEYGLVSTTARLDLDSSGPNKAFGIVAISDGVNICFYYPGSLAPNRLELQIYATPEHKVTVSDIKFEQYNISTMERSGFEFSLYAGTDRSYAQEELPWVVFSNKYENIVNTNYCKNVVDYKNVAMVLGQGEGAEQDVREVKADEKITVKGLDRLEMTVDSGSSIDESEYPREYDYEGDDHELSEEEKAKYEEDLKKAQDAAKEKYEEDMKTEGQVALADKKITEIYDGEVDYRTQFVYGKDYFMGDIVQIVNEYGREGHCRITELMMSEDSSGDMVVPTFVAVDDKEKEGT